MAHDADTSAHQIIPAGSTVLVVGASGSIGRHVVAEALRAGYVTRALIRDPGQASLFPEQTQVMVGDPTKAATFGNALDGVAGVIFTQGTFDEHLLESVNYGSVRNVVNALKTPARIALMTALGVTKPTPGHDWKRRGERLVRASGLPYTIVRPGWFDYNEADEHRLVLRQGDTHWTGNASDGVVSRQQIAQVLVVSLASAAADGKTFELVAEKGEAQAELEPLFAVLLPDTGLDGPQDRDNLPLAAEPQNVLSDLEAIRGRYTA